MAALPGFEPDNEYLQEVPVAESFEPEPFYGTAQLRGLIERDGVLYFDEYAQPIELEDRRSRFNWREIAFWAGMATSIVLLWTLMGMAVKAA